jgi:hypothetical protein
VERNKRTKERRMALTALLSCLSDEKADTPFNDSSFERNYLFEIRLLGMVTQFVV